VPLLESKLRLRDKLVVETDMELVVLLADVVGGNARTEGVGRCQDEGKIDVLGLSIAEVVTNAQNLSTANHLVNGTETKLGHDSTKLVGDVVEEVDNVLRGTLELASQLGVLGGNTDRASVQVAFSTYKVSSSSSKEASSRQTYLIMIQPIAMRGVVAKPHSSAPNKQAIATSRPVRS
jgi:hypothetical protein